MANQISKQAIQSFLNERYEERSKNRNQSTEGKYFYLNDGAITFINSLILNIEAGRFDETEYITYPNGAMIDKKITSDLEVSI